MLGPIIAGAVFDATGNLHTMPQFAAAMLVLGSLVAALQKPLQA
jgi:hypothetical protein